MKKTLIECLGNVTDYRSGNGVDHKLIDILVISILAVICEANYWTELEALSILGRLGHLIWKLCLMLLST
ncbi:MAG TPA: transposase family protein [Clostridiales bacterium]|nr:transposase family protein [Clostridiales bacterium]